MKGGGRCLRGIGLRKKAFLLWWLQCANGVISRAYLQAPYRARILNGLLTTLHLSIELPAKATHKRDTGFLSHSMPWEEQQQSARACHHFYFMWASEVGKRYNEIYHDALCAATSWWGVITRRRPRDPDMRIWVASAATAPRGTERAAFTVA